MPDPAEVIETEELTFDDDLLGAEDVGEEEVQDTGEAAAQAEAAPDPATAPDPEWKQAGFSSEGDYYKSVAREREAELKSYRDDKNIQAYKAQQEQERQRREVARTAAAKAEDEGLMALGTELGMPAPMAAKFAGGLKQILAQKDQQYAQALEGIVQHFEGKVAQIAEPLQQAMTVAEFNKQAPPELHPYRQVIMEQHQLARQAGASPEDAAKIAAGVVWRVRQQVMEEMKGGGVKPTGGKPNLQVARQPRLESTDTGGGDTKDTESWDKISKSWAAENF